ncbi:MAG: hypothetical protein RL223_3769 [Pseudomonadota bacterium]|jgi:hypothetical protein
MSRLIDPDADPTDGPSDDPAWPVARPASGPALQLKVMTPRGPVGADFVPGRRDAQLSGPPDAVAFLVSAMSSFPGRLLHPDAIEPHELVDVVLCARSGMQVTAVAERPTSGRSFSPQLVADFKRLPLQQQDQVIKVTAALLVKKWRMRSREGGG